MTERMEDIPGRPYPDVEKYLKDKEENGPKSRDERLDEGLDESFPASDPPAVTRERKAPSDDK